MTSGLDYEIYDGVVFIDGEIEVEEVFEAGGGVACVGYDDVA